MARELSDDVARKKELDVENGLPVDADQSDRDESDESDESDAAG